MELEDWLTWNMLRILTKFTNLIKPTTQHFMSLAPKWRRGGRGWIASARNRTIFKEKKMLVFFIPSTFGLSMIISQPPMNESCIQVCLPTYVCTFLRIVRFVKIRIHFLAFIFLKKRECAKVTHHWIDFFWQFTIYCTLRY